MCKGDNNDNIDTYTSDQHYQLFSVFIAAPVYIQFYIEACHVEATIVILSILVKHTHIHTYTPHAN